jgi:hypothetical protein
MFGESPSILALAPRHKPHRISRRITEVAPDLLRSTPFEIAASSTGLSLSVRYDVARRASPTAPQWNFEQGVSPRPV